MTVKTSDQPCAKTSTGLASERCELSEFSGPVHNEVVADTIWQHTEVVLHYSLISQIPNLLRCVI